MQIGMSIGGGANAGVIQVSSDPDGVLTAQRGTLAIDTTTGVTWKNRAGGTAWDPIEVPIEYGFAWKTDFETSLIGFTQTNVATGTSGFAPNPTGRAGVAFTGVTAVADAALIRASSAMGILFGSGKASFRTATQQAILSDATNDFTVRFGWGDSITAADHVDGIYFECSRATNGDNRWRLCTSSNSVRTKTDTGVAPTANVYQGFEIRVNAAGTSVDAYINGALVATNTTNIPTASGRDCSLSVQQVKDLGATQRFFNFDYLQHWMVLSAARIA